MKKIFFVLILIFTSILFNLNVYGTSNYIDVGSETLDNVITKNGDETAIYDYESNTLTLTNYNGGPIIYGLSDSLNIVLNGNNTVTSDFMYEGIASYYSNINISGEGTLLVKNGFIGIGTYGGDILLDNKRIEVENATYQGVSALGGKLTINAKLSLDTDEDYILNELGYFDRYTAIYASKDTVINNDIDIKNAAGGISSDGNLTINTGIINVEAEDLFHIADTFNLLGGKVFINLSNALDYGLDASKINLVNGYLHIISPTDTAAMVAIGDGINDPEITIGNKLTVNPDNYSIIDTLVRSVYDAKAFADNNKEVLNELTINAKETVKFNTDGGSTINDLNVMYGNRISKPTDPTRNNDIFDGWYIDEKFNEKYDFDNPVLDDITIYAKWLIDHDINVLVNDEKMGSVVSNYSKAKNGTIINLTANANDGYHFVKWESNDVDISSNSFTMIDKDVNITAVFEKNSYVLSFESNGGSGNMDDISNLYGIYILPNNSFIAPNDKIFKGWSLSKNGEIISELDMNDNKVVYAIWDDSSHIYNYIFLKGDNQDLEVGKIKEYVLKIDGDYLLFDNIKIGNLDLVNNEDYKVTEGSTVITFTKKGISKLNKLSKGKYDVLVSYKNGKKVNGYLTLSKNYSNDILNPGTGVSTNDYIIILSISFLSFISFIVLKNIIKNN